MARFQGGDRHAYETLVRRHLELVIRHARRYVGDDASAEDVAQNVFLRLFRSRERFREAKNFSGWLVTITTRLALNELRTRRRKRWVTRGREDASEREPEWRVAGSGIDPPDEPLLREERIAAVRSALARLPDHQRQAILLQRFEGWDLTRIGETMELSVPAVKSLLHRARRALETMLEPILGEEARRP